MNHRYTPIRGRNRNRGPSAEPGARTAAALASPVAGAIARDVDAWQSTYEDLRNRLQGGRAAQALREKPVPAALVVCVTSDCHIGTRAKPIGHKLRLFENSQIE